MATAKSPVIQTVVAQPSSAKASQHARLEALNAKATARTPAETSEMLDILVRLVGKAT